MNDLPDMIFATSTSTDGNMDLRFAPEAEVRRNRAAFLARYEIAPEACAVMQCTHGLSVVEAQAGSSASSDALITDTRGCCLFLLTADCLPVALVDERRGACALIHASRSTIAGGLIAKSVHALIAAYGVRPNDLHALIGPHIRRDSYAFDLPLASVDPAIAPFITYENGRAYIDLTAACDAALRSCGIERITDTEADTATGVYFSHYRAVRDPEEAEGRMANILMLR